MSALTLSPFATWMGAATATADLARSLEDHGYGALWLGGSPTEVESIATPLLEATTTLVVATGIVNIWRSPAAETAVEALRLLDRFPDRFILGVGAGHPERDSGAEKPMDATLHYLDALDAAGVPRERMMLAALGPRMLRLAAERTAGAHPYLTPPAHTAQAREELGGGPLLVPEQRVVLESDPVVARAIARPTIERPYLALRNYRGNLLRLGFPEEELDNGGSDRVIDELAGWGEDARVAARIQAHLDAGADQVAIQLLGPAENLAAGFARLSTALTRG